ncbi:MAG: tail fiber protein [Bacteroidia bacterium]
MEGMIGEIRMFAGNFAPKTWAFCSGQIVNIASNTALFSILGTTYGGNGTTTFALPDLRGRMAVGTGTGPGLSPIALGAKSGVETITLTTNNLPPHTHAGMGTVNGNWGMTAAEEASTNVPSGNVPASGQKMWGTDNAVNMGTAPVSGSITATIANSGAGFPFSVMGPYLAVYYIICQNGLFPSRN